MNFDLLRQRTTRYFDVAAWLLSDSLWRYRVKAVRVLILNGLALVLQAFALGALLTYAHALEREGVWSISGYTFGEPRSSYSLLLTIIVISVGSYMISSFLKLKADHANFDMARQYSVFCASRLIFLVSHRIHEQNFKKGLVNTSQLQNLLMQGSLMCGRALHRVVNGLFAIVGFAVFIGILLYLDSMLVLIVVAVTLFFIFFFYRLSVIGARNMRCREKLKTKTAEDRRYVLDALRYAPVPFDSLDSRPLRMIERGSISAAFDSTFRVQSISVDSAFVNGIVQATAIALIALSKGWEIITAGTGFGELVVFIAAGRFALSYFQDVTNTLVMTNRFYPMVTDYFTLIKALNHGSENATHCTQKLVTGLTVSAPPLNCEEHTDTPSLEPGLPFAVVSPQPIDRFSLPEILPALRMDAGNQTKRATGVNRVTPDLCYVVPARFICIGTLNGSVGLADDLDVDELRCELAALGISKASLDSLPAANAPIGNSQWEKLAPAVLAGAGMLAALRSRRPIFVVARKALVDVGKTASDTFIKRASTRIVIISYGAKDTRDIGVHGEAFALIVDGKAIMGFDSVERVREDSSILRALTPQKNGKNCGAEDIDDDA